VLKCQFGYLKARYRGLAKNTAQIDTQFALANLWMARKDVVKRKEGRSRAAKA
jgi:IS5 family transposase